MTDAPSVDVAVLPCTLTNAFRFLRDVPILHLLEVTKVNRRGRRQRRVLVITSTHLYSCMENGTIQRCVAARNISSVHMWLGASPCVGLKVPSEYDMLFILASPREASELAAAVYRVGGIDAVEHDGAPGAAEYRLERPRGFARAMASSVQWVIGEAGACPPRSQPQPQPFVAAGAGGAVGVRPPQQQQPTQPPQWTGAGEEEETFGAMTIGPDRFNDVVLDASHEIQESGADYSDDDEQTEGTDYLKAESKEGDTNYANKWIREESAARVKEENGAESAGEARRQALEDALREERWRRTEEQERWRGLIAAERRNAHQLREIVTELRSQVVELSAKNIALRSQFMATSWIHNQVDERPK